jgi:hypothetical protein
MNSQPDTEKNQQPDNIAYDATISMTWANIVALLLFPVTYLIFFVPYQLIWGEDLLTLEQVIRLNWGHFLLFIVILMASIMIHEWLHVIGFVYVGKAPRTSIKYGFSWKGLAPYAHCRAPMTASAYRTAVILPGLVLGLLPGVVGIASDLNWLVLWAALMLVSAGGDTAVLLAIRAVPGEAMVQDHPSKAGCQVLR